MLCFPCNAALGNLKDSPELFRRAAAYLEGGTGPLKKTDTGVFVLPRMIEPPTWLRRCAPSANTVTGEWPGLAR